MKREELIKLKKMYNQELERRTRINQLLKEDNVLEYLKLNGINLERMQIEDTWSIIKELLKNIEITETNSILVHTSNYMLEGKYVMKKLIIIAFLSHLMIIKLNIKRLEI